MKSSLCLFILWTSIAISAIAQSNSAPDTDIKKSFLYSNSTWQGDFQNYVNRKDGVVQSGKIRVELTTSGDTIMMRNIFLNPNGEPTDYTGYSTMLVEGDAIFSLDESGVDENTGNKIIDYQYMGRILDNHIFIHETYKEVFPEGVTEQRSNSVHYYLMNNNEVIQLAEVWVDHVLLVFAGTRLKKLDEEVLQKKSQEKKCLVRDWEKWRGGDLERGRIWRNGEMERWRNGGL